MPLVRRLPAIFLLSVFSLALIVPVVWLEPDSKLPACCRREGLHHCAMTAESSGGSAIQAVCPVFPGTSAAPAYSKLTGARPLQAVEASIAAQTAVRARTEILAHSFSHRAQPKRGPPAFLS